MVEEVETPAPERKSGFIAIVGRPNAGKSTLLNTVLGAKVSIVTPKAQTTRERVLGILTEPRGQMVFVDTPGIHRAKQGGINEYMVSEAREALDGPSLIWYLADPRSALEHENEVLNLLEKSGSPVVLIMSKGDLAGKLIPAERYDQLQAILSKAMTERKIQLKSARRIAAQAGEGLEDLMAEAWATLPIGPVYFPDEEQISDRPVRYFVAEKIREQLLLLLGEEIPYSCAVEIESYDEGATPPRIEAVIHVERDSQKGMVVGKGGAKIKEIGSAARREIESFVGTQVFLGLRVKLLKDWTRDAEKLKRMGYNLPKDPPKARKKGNP